MEPTNIGEYRVVRRLGEGGMGEVFLVDHPRLPRQDAVKLLSRALSADPQFTARFDREAQILAEVKHPHIVVVYDRGEHDGRLWLAMEYVDGADAAQVLRERGPLPAAAVADVVDGVGSALDAVWQGRGLSHRDVKPANILLEFHDPRSAHRPTAVKLVDFGIAKAADEASSLTATGTTVGTMTYMAPEAVESRPLDNRADLYSLACAAFELLTGSPPYPGTGVRALMMAHVGAPIPDPADRLPGVPTALGPVFRRALAKEPGDRYATGAEFAAAFRAALDLPAEVPTRATPRPTVPFVPPPAATAPPPRTLPVVPIPPAAIPPAAPPPAVTPPVPAAASASSATSGSGPGLWLAAGAIVLVVLLGIGGYLWLTSGVGGDRGGVAAPTGPPTGAVTSAPESSAAPSSSAVPVPTVAGTDARGFVGSYARCAGDEQLLQVALTEPSHTSGLPAQVVICAGPAGPVYRAAQVGDAVGINLTATRTADGYSAFNANPSGVGGTGYATTPAGVTVTSPDGSRDFLRWTQIWQRPS